MSEMLLWFAAGWMVTGFAVAYWWYQFRKSEGDTLPLS